jgi:cytoskeletal protein CcmA (bactofilin family)
MRGCCCGGCAGVPERRRGQLKKSDDVSPTEERTNSAASNVPYIGKTVVIKGELNGSEDLTIDGQFDGRIELRDHTLMVGRNSIMKADLIAKSVDILGRVTGNVTAVDMVRIGKCGNLNGNIKASRVVVAEGANFRGRIDTPRDGGDLHDGAPVKAPAPMPWMAMIRFSRRFR